MIETAITVIILVALVTYILNKNSITMPMSWDDYSKEYKPCFHCKEYLLRSDGTDNVCKEKCQFYPYEKEINSDNK
jgi:hypothetical protein